MKACAISLPAEGLGFIDCGPVDDTVAQRIEHGCRVVCKDGYNVPAVPAAKTRLQLLFMTNKIFQWQRKQAKLKILSALHVQGQGLPLVMHV